MEGYIHSLESFGTVDGPGVRYVVFFQGCPFPLVSCPGCEFPMRHKATDKWSLRDLTPHNCLVV